MTVARDLVVALDAVLPQTQCERCGYKGCRPYAQAMAAGEAPADRCPPGGEFTARRLAAVLGAKPKPVDPECGQAALWTVAKINEKACIGCVLCVQACPVDAISGAPKRMHTVLSAECTGCELCISPCPVDCIELVLPQAGREGSNSHPGGFAQSEWRVWMTTRAGRARQRKLNRDRRLAVVKAQRAQRRVGRGNAVVPLTGGDPERVARTIQAALNRVAARRASRSPRPVSQPPEEQS